MVDVRQDHPSVAEWNKKNIQNPYLLKQNEFLFNFI